MARRNRPKLFELIKQPGARGEQFHVWQQAVDAALSVPAEFQGIIGKLGSEREAA